MRRQSKLVYTDTGAINIEAWLHNLSLERHKSNQSLLREACLLAQVAGEEQTTPNGESCLHQGLAMAEMLADLNLDDDTLAAALVYSSVHNAGLSLEDVAEHLGIKVAKLITGAHQMDALHSLHGRLTHRAHLTSTVDNLRKMLLAIVDDVRVVFIKLAERLCILRNMLNFKEAEICRIAKETKDIYAPLANRLGIGHIKWQLEDLAFRYLQPEDYHQLSRGLKERRVDRENYVEQLISSLRTELAKSGMTGFEVTGRAKHIYSIYKKMERKRVSLDEIYDAIAFRILVPTLDDCYSALSIVHSLWQHIPKEFDDYIIHPKPNGYRSIHTAVEGPQGKFVEIQIRTFNMHKEAELGVAAHWVYKEGGAQNSYEQKIAWLRQVMSWQEEVVQSEQESQEIFSHLFEDRIYVFTPNGDVIDLPSGSTPLDFAYLIHSELGHHCRGAKVNGAIVPLTYSLRLGDNVEILTLKQGHPSRDWLNPHLGYLKTARAKAKVLNWFRKQDHDRNLAEGQALLEKELKRMGVRDLSYEALSDSLNYKSKEDMLVAIGRGDLRMHNVLLAVQTLTHGSVLDCQKVAPTLSEAAKAKMHLLPADITIEGVANLLTYLAKCCKPVPGDEIAGYVTLGRGISVHRKDCQNLLDRASLYPDRKIALSWGSKTLGRYPVDLSILAYERPNLLQDIASLLANDHISILSINVIPNRENQTTICHLTIEVDSLNPLSRLLARFSQLQGVMAVQRE
jgi:GTP pyrophosphokinase